MSTENAGLKFAIIETVKATGEQFIYSTITAFVKHNPQYKANTIYNWISRKQIAYDNGKITLERKEIFR